MDKELVENLKPNHIKETPDALSPASSNAVEGPSKL
jgi:hypothetical protein